MLRSPRLLAGVTLVSVLLLTLNIIWLTVDRDTTVSSRSANWSVLWARLQVAAGSAGRDGTAPCRRGTGQVSARTASRPAGGTVADPDLALLPVPENTLLLGQPRADTGFLTIGIASVFRKERYLSRTLTALIECSTPAERANVFFTNVDGRLICGQTTKYVNPTSSRLSELSSQFHSHVSDGFLQFIQPPPDLYPDLNFTGRRRRTFNDKSERVAWRTKQVVDFSFLFSYCHKLSEYYMVLEDDVTPINRYVTAIRDFIHMHRRHDWVGLKFSQYMIIGDLVRSSSLPRLVQLMTMFREEQPVDFIMAHFVSMMVNAPGVPTRRVPPLFNHIGHHSTLVNKTQKILGHPTYLVPRHFQHDNPAADVVTNLKIVTGHLAPYAYSAAPGFFLGQVTRGKIGTLDVALTRRRRLQRVVVMTGEKQRHRLKQGRLLAAAELLRVTSTAAECADWTLLAVFAGQSGTLDVRAVDRLAPGGVQCVRVEVGRNHTGMVAVTEIVLFDDD